MNSFNSSNCHRYQSLPVVQGGLPELERLETRLGHVFFRAAYLFEHSCCCNVRSHHFDIYIELRERPFTGFLPLGTD